jgi:hypothetical protein
MVRPPFSCIVGEGFLLLLEKAEGRRQKVEGGGQRAGGRGQEGKGCCHVLAVRSALVYLAIAIALKFYGVAFCCSNGKKGDRHIEVALIASEAVDFYPINPDRKARTAA